MKLISLLFKSSSLVTRTVAQLAVVGTVGTLSFGVMSSSAFTNLNAVAQNTSPVVATSGNLSLTQVDNGVGFSTTPTTIANIAPGDIVNRYVDYTNGGTLSATGLTLKVADASTSGPSSGNTALTTDATYGLHVTVTSCSTSWDHTSGACTGTGTTAVLLTSTALSALKTSAAILIPATTTILPNAVERLQFSITLPDKSETTTNGTLPTGTIQGLSASLTWTLTEVQAALKTTNS